MLRNKLGATVGPVVLVLVFDGGCGNFGFGGDGLVLDTGGILSLILFLGLFSG